ncbi:MAG: Stk1 family PASTA domain-containing Ser/Thr kinase [Candidatus Eremiobacteraeota bacterium]|nr:Stk1 family PASTA domain-containing Ser/Thr kinase [Candidatus Eremiobacteraeota bacterium]
MIEERGFNNRYRLDRKLGEGGMATVYCGTDILLRRRVAIKVLREQYAADAEFVRRFYQEAESAAKLSHPNIVNTYDVGHEGDTYFIVMELVDGPSLAEIIAADGRLPEPVAIDYAVQIASGLAYAHRQGLLHRDIKPANVLVTKDDVVKLSDFGIARAVSQQTMALTKPGLVMGSVYYISPEQAQEHEIHETSDLYSLGVVLYQMLTGKLPYTGESPVTVALKHIGDPVPTIDTKTTGVSPALASIVNRLLQKKPEHRFASASDLATALREARERPAIAGYRIADDAPTQAISFAQGRSSRTLPPRRSPMPDRPYRLEEEGPRRSSGWAVIGLIAALLAATALGYLVFGRSFTTLGGGVAVGDYTGMTQAQAQEAVVNAGLRTRFTKTASETVPPDHVIRQTPPAGTRVERNQVVELFISNGKPLIGLVDVRGYNVNDAQRTLQQEGFAVTLTRRYDNTVADNVIDQSPKASAKVFEGSRVTLIVSQGPQPVVVPNFVSMPVEVARRLADRLGITLDASQSVPGMPPGTIGSQNVAQGTKVDRNATVRVVVNSGMLNGPPSPAADEPTVALPSVVGQDYDSARRTLTEGGFQIAVRYQQQNANNGTIVGQTPPGGQVPQGSTVILMLSVSGEVPDTVGLTAEDAIRLLRAYGYSVAQWQYTTAVGADGKVVGTEPPAGTPLAPGSSLTVTVNGTPRP